MRSVFLSILGLLAGVFCNAPAPLCAQDKVLLGRDGRVNVFYQKQVSTFLDEDSRFLVDPDAVLREKFSVSNDEENLNRGYSNGTLWVRFHFINDAGNDHRMVLTMKQSTLNRVTLYKVVGGHLQVLAKTGGAVPMDERSHNSLGLHLRMGTPPLGESEYILCLEPMGGILDAAFTISYTQRWVYYILTPSLLFHGLFFGLLLSLMISNALTWYLTGQAVHIYYVGYVGCMIAIVANMEGLLDWLLPWSALGGWIYLTPTFSAFVAIALFLMLKNFYGADREFPRLARLFQGLVAFNVLIIVLNIFGLRQIGHIMVDAEFLPVAVIALASAFHVWKQGFRPALFMLMARIVMLGFTGVYILKVYNVFPSNMFTDHAFQIGTLCEMIIVYLGLAVHLKELETEKDVAQKNERLATVRLDWFNTLVRVITHDMSTPISIISTSVDLELRRQQPSSSLKRNLERIQRSVNQQSDLVGHVREMIAVTTGKKTLNRVPIHLQKKLEGLLLNFTERMESKQVKVQLDMPSEPLHVLAEATALEHTILANFLSNAIKFSRRDGVVRVVLRRDQNDVVIRFEDTGIGIPADLMEKLFDPTKATSRPGTANESGTGFGLPIARVYIEQFHGTVTVQTRVAENEGDPSGTIFEVRFPLCEAPSDTENERATA